MKIKQFKKIYHIIFLAIITFGVFWQVANHEFILWDDDIHVYKNPYMNPVTLQSFSHFWEGPHDFALTYTVWAMQAVFAKSPGKDNITLNPHIFHITNLIFHILNVIVIFLILQLLVKNSIAACGGALLFALHPIQVEPVAWITGLKDILSGTMSLIAIWQYLLYAKSTLISNNEKTRAKHDLKYIHYITATTFFILAITAKPTAVVIPLVAWILDFLIIKRPVKESIKPLIIWIIIIIPFVILTKLSHPAVAIGFNTPLLKRPLIFGDTLAFYLYKLFWPISLGPHYGRMPRFVLRHTWIYFTWLLPFGLAILFWLWRKRRPWLLMSLGIFVAAILPVSGLITFRFQNYSTVADRYLYLAMLGPSIALTFFFLHNRKKNVLIISVLIISLLGYLSIKQTKYWKNTLALFKHNLKINPKSWLAYNKIGGTLALEGKLNEAIIYFSKAIQIWPEYEKAHYNLGLALVMQGRSVEAINHLYKASHLKPSNAQTHYDIGRILSMHGNLKKAILYFSRALEINPNFAEAHNEIGVALARQGNLKQAFDHFFKALQINPDDPKIHFNLGYAFSLQGKINEAISYYSNAIRINPNYVEAHQALVNVHKQTK